jgi:hypothetical protein
MLVTAADVVSSDVVTEFVSHDQAAHDVVVMGYLARIHVHE